jgi:hypothetical protein
MALPGLALLPSLLIEGSAAASAGAAGMAAISSSKQATAASEAANYNAKVDQARAQQLAMNAQANIAKQRQDNAEYQSQQRAALAASGVLSDTGSPMAMEATTAGRQEQDIQQYWTSVQEQEAGLYSAAQEGVYEGAEEAEAYHLQGASDLFQGVGGVAGAFGKYSQPTASGSTDSTTGNNLF